VGHLELLEFARSQPNSYVLVLIDTDARVKAFKGNDRPVNNEQERIKLLTSLKFVDQVDTFNSDSELEEKIKLFGPDVMIKGSDYQGCKIIGAEHCKEIKFYERLEQYSTTKKIQHIINRR
jgi:D-beta-D-heptose 7-phosphate kinase/D-beta-D-heptose 1-phosphate adenosyltransferase